MSNTTKGPIQVTRTNYDRFETRDGTVYGSEGIRLLREQGYEFVVADKTPAEQGTWTLEPLN